MFRMNEDKFAWTTIKNSWNWYFMKQLTAKMTRLICINKMQVWMAGYVKMNNDLSWMDSMIVVVSKWLVLRKATQCWFLFYYLPSYCSWKPGTTGMHSLRGANQFYAVFAFFRQRFVKSSFKNPDFETALTKHTVRKNEKFTLTEFSENVSFANFLPKKC